MNAFKSPASSFGRLDPRSTANLIAAAADVAIVTDRAGVISDIAFQSEALAAELPEHARWRGRGWAETVTIESRPKVEALLSDAAAREAPAKWRHINYPSAGGADIPILFSAIRIAEDGRVVGFGRDLRPISELQQRLVEAQQSLERDYARLQQIETRYRILFQMSPEAVVILDSASHRILEANPAATELLGDGSRRVLGRSFTDLFEPGSLPAVQTLLAAIRTSGRGEDVHARLARNGREAALSAYLFRHDNEQLSLVRLVPAPEDEMVVPGRTLDTRLVRLFEQAPDAFVLTGGDGDVLTANAAFLAMTQLASEDQARGESLDRWLGRPGVDLGVLIANLRQRGAVRMFATTLRDEFGAVTNIEISAAAVIDGNQTCYGFFIRNVGRRQTDAPVPGEGPRGTGTLHRSVEQLTELIGRVSLKDLVREATDIIERLCIEAALEMTGDNRASAAELLGLSRQSLYVKLRRYGLGDLGGEPEAE